MSRDVPRREPAIAPIDGYEEERECVGCGRVMCEVQGWKCSVGEGYGG